MPPHAEIDAPSRTREPGSASCAGATLLALAALLPQAPESAVDPGEQDLARALAEVVEPHFAGPLPRRPHYLQVRDGWILKTSLRTFRFLNSELFAPTEGEPEDAPAAPLTRIVATIADTQRQLAENGIELLVVPIPMRLNIYPEALLEVELDSSFRGCGPGLGQFCADLREAGVEVLELLPHLSAERGDPSGPADQLVFMRINGHWSPRGLAVGAEAIARDVRARPWFEALGDAGSRLERADAPWKPDGERFPEGIAPPSMTFERVLDPGGRPVARTDKTSPVALWGDSFTTIFKAEGADLPRRLNHLLGGPLDVIATLGGGADSTRLNFARRRNAMAGKRLVIWTFSTRSLMAGKWETMRLQRP